MRRFAAGLRLVWEFVVGDDWRIAASVAVALAGTALLTDAGIAAWWLLPAAVGVMLAVSVVTVGRGGNSVSGSR